MISKTGTTVLRALAELAALPPDAHAGAAAIARRIGARANYLGKMLQQLAAAGLVISQKGLGGGFRLARSPERISLFDILDPIEHIDRWSGCILGQASCSAEAACPLHERWARVRDQYLDFLRQTTLAEAARRLQDAGPNRRSNRPGTRAKPGAGAGRQTGAAYRSQGRRRNP